MARFGTLDCILSLTVMKPLSSVATPISRAQASELGTAGADHHDVGLDAQLRLRPWATTTRLPASKRSAVAGWRSIRAA
jgi:hypothetical protein